MEIIFTLSHFILKYELDNIDSFVIFYLVWKLELKIS